MTKDNQTLDSRMNSGDREVDAEQQADFQRLMSEIKAGSEEAVTELLGKYGHHILRVIRRRMNQQLRSQFDSQDYVQAVWASFFAHREKISRFGSPEELLAFLQQVANNKVIDDVRRFYTKKKNIRRNRSIESTVAKTGDMPQDDSPTASEVAVANEQLTRFLQGQPERNRQIIELRIAGETYTEIARKLNLNERTARRVVASLSPRLG